jgi:hypothetical protein
LRYEVTARRERAWPALVPWGQGYRYGTGIDALELAIMERKLVHPKQTVSPEHGHAVSTMDPGRQEN